MKSNEWFTGLQFHSHSRMRNLSAHVIVIVCRNIFKFDINLPRRNGNHPLTSRHFSEIIRSSLWRFSFPVFPWVRSSGSDRASDGDGFSRLFSHGLFVPTHHSWLYMNGFCKFLHLFSVDLWLCSSYSLFIIIVVKNHVIF